MRLNLCDFYKYSVFGIAILFASASFAAQAPNPRSATDTVSVPDTSGLRAAGRNVVQTSNQSSNSSARATADRSANTVSRSATSRPTATVSRNAVSNTTVKNVNSGRSATTRQNVVNVGANSARTTAVSAARSATSSAARSGSVPLTATTARAGKTNNVVNSSRSSVARATAVFDDISKIGGGYATCREAYATCMDQFCAKANETYRRCFCSSKYAEFRDTEAALDEAINLLAQFESNNLEAVELSAEEVAAMYSATEGENAIKNDTSAAASMLSEISDLLSGNKKVTTNTNTGTSLGILDIDFSTDLGDIWGNSGTGSIFDTSTGVDLAALEGESLYNAAHKQCLEVISDSCENDAVLQMAQSAYGILVTQDCNTYETKIDSQKEKVQQTVRTAEKYLREARLAEYRSHNSADVNECISKVQNAMTTDVACGANYKKCLDYTGAYINQTTGEPIYSPRLFQLQDLISLDGVSDNILGQNPQFNSFLDSKRMFAESALDTCRDISDIVWEEFKRQALIEIAQAQDEKIEEVKMSCVSTMADCYDTQTSALKSFDDTTAQYAGAISAYAAKEMCQDQVIACASLYGNVEGCKFDGNGKLITGNNVSGANANQMCGLTSLLAFVDTVDNVRISEGCTAAIDSYLKELCTPTSGDKGYPWNCRLKKLGDFNTDKPDSSINATLASNIKQFAITNCTVGGTSWDDVPAQSRQDVQQTVNGLAESTEAVLMDTCEELGGVWVGNNTQSSDVVLLSAFYSQVYGGDTSATSWGKCVENTTMIQCLNYNSSGAEPVASYDATRDECVFTDAWYEERCSMLGGYYQSSTCYVNSNK